MVFYGDYNGDLAAGIHIIFAECDSKNDENCLSKEKKKEFFAKGDYFIVTIQNSEEFMAEEFDTAKVIAGES